MKQLNRKTVLTISSYILVALIAFSITYGTIKRRQNGNGVLVNHGPIIIVNDSDFEVYDFPGKGTIEDPYLIQNYNITTDYSESIYISGTSKHFIIQNCYLKADFKSLFIENVDNSTVKIQDNTIVCAEDTYSIYIIGSNKITIERNKIKNLIKSWTWPWAPFYFKTMEIIQSDAPVIKNNLLIGQNIWIKESMNSSLSNNLFKGGSYSLTSYIAFDSPNSISHDNEFKITVVVNIFSSNNIFSNNTFSGERAYIYLYSYNNTFSGNRINNQGYIRINSPNSIIKDNQINFGSYTIVNYYDSINTLRSYSIQNNTVHTKLFGYFVDSEYIDISTSLYGQLFLVNCKNVTITGFRIESSNTGIIVTHSKNVILEDVGSPPASTGPPTKRIVLYNTTDCKVIDCSGSSGEASLEVIKSSNITIEGNSYGWSSGYGLRIDSSTGILISNNYLADHDEGISVSNSNDILMMNNTIYRSRKWGITVYDSSNILAANNKIDVSNEGGIRDRYNNEFEIYD
ncbi:MAG: right-handed parallel beta-helix repeat-containing protein, partial [Candidatus Heimdallarchaeaceae archaeon]